jgi:hypothetical protein
LLGPDTVVVGDTRSPGEARKVVAKLLASTKDPDIPEETLKKVRIELGQWEPK